MNKGWTLAKRVMWCLLPIALPIGYMEVYVLPIDRPHFSSSCTFFSAILLWTTWFFVETIWKASTHGIKMKIVYVLVVIFWSFLLLCGIKILNNPIEYMSYKLITAVVGSMIALPSTLLLKYKLKFKIDHKVYK